MTVLPTLFVSHGSPMIVMESGETIRFWEGLGRELPRPRSVLCISAHWYTRQPLVSAASQMETIHDFYGFPPELYRLSYPAPGAPDLARQVEALLRQAGIPLTADPARGLDHGAWVPLRSFYPGADVPATQLSVQPQLDAGWHYRIGQALAPLREDGVLILGSGGATHNLGELQPEGAPVPRWAQEFDDWLAAALAAGDLDALLAWEKAPNAARAHPSPEHFLPLFIAYGAAGPQPKAARIHQGFTLGGLSMAAFQFAA